MSSASARIATARRVLVPRRIAMRVHAPSAASLHRLAGETMGTTWSVSYIAPPAHDAAALNRMIARELEVINREMSPWRADSDISRFNAAPAGTWHVLPPMFFAVLSRAHALARNTAGAYDPACGHLVNLWGFGPPRVAQRPPSPGAIAAALAVSGHEKLRLDPARRAALQPGGLALDLSSIAKGFAVDHISELLLRRELADHLVEIGGELRGSGMKPDGSPWWVRIETPGIDRETIAALHGLAVATSGEAQRYFEDGGRRYAHTLDPRTGWPVDNGMISVTVIHESCVAADALATALTVLGPDQGTLWAETRDVAALFVVQERGGNREVMTPALATLLG